jgi:hypothetical protein
VTADELRQAGIEIFGSRGWTSALASRLGIDRVSVWRYVSGQLPVPGPVAAAVQCWLRELHRVRS